MIYHVLSEPCVYISCYYGNVQGAAGADDIGGRVTDSRGTLSRHRFSTSRTIRHCRSGGWSVEGQGQDVL